MNHTPTTPGLVLSDLTLSAIQAEATRAHLRHGANSILNLPDDRDRFDVLAEEVGEVARELNERRIGNTTPAQYRERIVRELIQVGAMAATFVEAVEGYCDAAPAIVLGETASGDPVEWHAAPGEWPHAGIWREPEVNRFSDQMQSRRGKSSLAALSAPDESGPAWDLHNGTHTPNTPDIKCPWCRSWGWLEDLDDDEPASDPDAPPYDPGPEVDDESGTSEYRHGGEAS